MRPQLQPDPDASAVLQTDGEGGLPRVVLTHSSGSRAEVYLHGAHVTSWRDAAGREALWVSRLARWSRDAAIRGGIPVVFPQFADRGPLPKHGFARTREWALVDHGVQEGAVQVHLRLRDDPETRALWPHPFEANLHIVLDSAFRVALEVVNPGEAAFDFTAALHTYFRISDVEGVRIRGLEGVAFRDKVQGNAQGVQAESLLRIRGETDRVYRDAPDELWIEDAENGIGVRKRGFPDAVVWNPGPELARKLDDFGDEEFRGMVCVEAACVERPVRLAAGERWIGEQLLTRPAG